MKTPNKKKRVMVYGTFDLLHPGHLNFLEQAKLLGGYLIVSVSRDHNAKKFKGHLPIFSERERLRIVSSLRMVDRAILGDREEYLPHTKREHPDIIALGYDQTAYGWQLEQDIKQGKLKARLVRLKPYKPRRHKSTRYKQLISGSARTWLVTS
ncbi:MAG: hypothetical protein A2722_03070 [Candidatus Doudnabacteria bacterium RIFCSPHIGHO2_01_FULL_50_11]|uniref:Cytidyltransferase-like domain-containing protein n=1 Tax=Candidatus Doudnabacteria bacterium RIFCSPHIGHO2_01_FULL_50_11 TaxID=1817828 RepID=A0A1F5PM37_9BACT|nr:MAG: hypothetical protein A2722_03070 [Candidatus Doudnabacteria bacterium RIFCSPHIGHO2_01_FULL_50_11]HLC44843.1 adenylyltransferase/cytidyltransferase family protein [Patescibacteria group bacterium]